jgi:LPXTG-site transpeptidase (sortase) family protein
MHTGTGGSGILPPRSSAVGRSRRRLWLSRLFLWLGGVLLLAAGAYMGLTRLSSWVMAQDRYLRVEPIGPLQIGDLAPIDADLPGALVGPVETPTPDLVQPPAHQAGPTLEPLPTATLVTRSQPTATPERAIVPSPQPQPTDTPAPPLPVQIRIPAISVDRSIIELPLSPDLKTGTWKLDVKSLFRRPGKDLVGHWVGSANPGQAGNMILVGHNYGYGYNGVFLNVGRLKAGQVLYVVNQAGETFTYKVTTVQRVKWSKKNEQELRRHQAYLSMGGPERLTLVTCGGATWEPFPDRVYVVAEPAR